MPDPCAAYPFTVLFTVKTLFLFWEVQKILKLIITVPFEVLIQNHRMHLKCLHANSLKSAIEQWFLVNPNMANVIKK